MPYKIKDPVRHKFKKKSYNKRDWKGYEQALRDSGDITIWLSEEAIAAWNYPVSTQRSRGRQKQYSDLAIETTLILGVVYHKRLRQTEGFMRSVVRLLGIDLCIPDHTTLSRRSRRIVLSGEFFSQAKIKSPLTVIIDSTGLKVFGEKEWMKLKHGTCQRKVWRKLHLCMDEKGDILSSALTCHQVSDTSQVDELLKAVDAPIEEVLGDGGYDHPATYQALNSHQTRHHQDALIKAIIPPNIGFQEGKDSNAQQRLNNIDIIEDKGKGAWQSQVKYGRRAKVETTIHRYKALIGNTLRSRSFASQITETKIAIKIINRMRRLCLSKALLSA